MHLTPSSTRLALIALLAVPACASAPGLGLATSDAVRLNPPLPVAGAEGASTSPAPRAQRRAYGTDWCFDAGAPVSGPPALGAAGQIYVATHEGYVHALNRDGAFRWSYTVKGSVIGGPELLPSGSVVVATNSQLLYALTPGGKRHWVFRVPEPISTPPSVSRKGTIVFGAADRVLYAISPYGGVMWRVPIKGGFATPPQVVADGLVAFGTEGGVLLVRGPNRQKLVSAPGVRELTAGPPSVGYGWALTDAGVVELSGGRFEIPDLEQLRYDQEHAELLAVTRSEALWLEPSGQVARRVRLPSAPSDAFVLDSHGAAYAPSNDGSLLMAKGTDDEFVQFARMGSSPLSMPLIDEARGRLVAAAGEGRVCAVSIENSFSKTGN